jgi:hypothetical protein
MKNSEPFKLSFGQFAFGRHYDIWCYPSIPSGMRLATRSDLCLGRIVLYKVRIGPDAGKYYTNIVTTNSIDIFKYDVDTGWPVYVRD